MRGGFAWGVGLMLALFGLLAGSGGVRAQDAAAEKRAFDAAARAFGDRVYDLAEREFAQFVQQYPQSSQVAEAILYQAQAAMKQSKLADGVALLTNNVAKAGPLADQYRYFQAEAYLQNGNYLAAADTFALLAKEFTNSVRLLEASYGEAQARFKLRELGRVVDLLQQPNGTFLQAVRVRSNDVFAVRGHLLLAEALLEQKNYRAAGLTLSRLAEGNLNPEFKWRRQYLICRAQMADQRWPDALNSVTNLLALAVASGQRNLLAESVVLEGEAHERLNEFDAAIAAYEKNLPDSVPPEYARQALVKIIELTLAQNKVADAAQRLGTFLTRHPGDAASDLALLTLGEVHLKLHLSGADTNRTVVATNSALAATNHLQAAMAQFDKLASTFTNSPFQGKAQLDRGWCFWLDGKIRESAVAFQAAVEKLPHSENQAVACFKLADAQFALKDFTNALQNYRAVVTGFDDLPRVKNTLFDQALYQSIRASLEVNDLASAAAAMKKILQWFPESFYRDRSLLLVGQSLTLANQPAAARGLFTDLAQRIPNSPLRPQVELAVARSYVQENNWTAAMAQYEQWIERFATNELRPEAEFNRAWAHYRAGRETNALALFTNFVAQFPTHTLAPEAQFWVGTYFFNQKDYVNAEKNFQDKILLQNTNFTHPARMMAVRAAYARQAWKDAYDYLTNIVSDPQCPTNLLAEAFYALGDTITLDPKRPLEKFDEAKEAFRKILFNTPTSPLVPAALGRIGDCYLQLATQDAKQYSNATNFYSQAMTSRGAEVKVRYQAEVGLAQTLEKMARLKQPPDEGLLKDAFDHCYNIVRDKSLRDGEKPDPFWFKEAGLAAGRLAEELKQWEVAVNIYSRLLKVLPQFRATWEKKIEKVSEQLRPEKS